MNSKLLAACTVLLSATAAFVEAKIRLEDFYDFGTAVNDQTVPVLDDGSTGLIKISTLFPFFNHQHDGLYVNNNGVISFLVQVSQFTPDAFPLSGSKRLIAPFWADVDIRNGGIIWYRETTNQTILKLATKDVRRFAPSQFRFQATWVFVATWDNVAFYGASNIGREKRNTFQAVLITNGRHSFTMFNYNNIQWVTGTASGGNADTGLGGIQAQVGFNAGDGINFASVNDSRTETVISIADKTNIKIIGKFFYQIDDESIKDGGCNIQGTLTITPRYSTMLGGEALVLSGPCFTGNETVSVKFGDGPQLRCSHIPNAVSCVTQSMFTTGDIPVILSYFGEDGTQSTFQGVFTAVNPALLSPKVTRINPTNWRDTGGIYEIQWDVDKILTENVKVELFVYQKVNDKPILNMLRTLAYGIRNTEGKANITLPKQENIGNNYALIILVSGLPIDDDLTPRIWSDAFIMLPSTIKRYSLCSQWLASESMNTFITNMPPCPCTLSQAKVDTAQFHTYCKRSCTQTSCHGCYFQYLADECVTLNAPTEQGFSMTCCYDESGQLLTHTLDIQSSLAQRFPYQKVATNNYLVPYWDNLASDVFPNVFCCWADHTSDNCGNFLEMRPPVSCENYEPPRPAGENGDPHFLTLDGKQFTFNGIGEYILVEDANKTFSIQIRAEQVKDRNGALRRASVMTALAIKTSEVVQVEMNSIRIADVFLNETHLDFTDVSWINFQDGSIQRTESNESVTVMVRIHKPQLSVQVTTNKWMMNVLFVVGSRTLAGNLRGLLGNYNGNPDDDFISRIGRILPSDLTKRDIHYNFGQTWMTSASESIFRYPTGKSHSSYQNPGFRPSFITLSTASITPRMKEVCGNNTDCLFDYIVTGSERMAESSQQFSEVIRKAVKAAVPVVLCGFPKLNNGTWNVSGRTEGSNATAQCHENYTLNGNIITISCMNNSQWSSSDAKCTPTVTEPKDGSSLPDDIPNPCTSAATSIGQFYFPHPDSRYFIQCNSFGDAWVKMCPQGTVWFQSNTNCGFQPNCQVGAFKLHPSEPNKYMHCGADGSYTTKTCSPGLVFNINIKACDWP